MIADVASLKGDFSELRNGFTGLRGEFTELKSAFKISEKNIELQISQAINTNMRWSIGMIALVVTVLKIADMFVK